MDNRNFKKVTTVLSLVTLLFGVTLYRVRAEDVTIPNYSYDGEGGPAPDSWGELSNGELCEFGTEQSPINILPPKGDDDIDEEELQFNYDPAPLVVINNGRVVEVEYDNGSTLSIDDETYELIQFHFHTPSEHAIVYNKAKVEAHLVHLSDEGEYAVVGVFIKSGEESDILSSILANVPDEGEKMEVENTEVDASDLLPANRRFYQYPGSFTTPPCTEDVTWVVFASPIEASDEQIEQLSGVFDFENVRPIQDLNDRDIQIVDIDDDDDGNDDDDDD